MTYREYKFWYVSGKMIKYSRTVSDTKNRIIETKNKVRCTIKKMYFLNNINLVTRRQCKWRKRNIPYVFKLNLYFMRINFVL